MLSHGSTNMQKAFSLHSYSGPDLLNDVIGLNNDFSLKERLIRCIKIPHKTLIPEDKWPWPSPRPA